MIRPVKAIAFPSFLMDRFSLRAFVLLWALVIGSGRVHAQTYFRNNLNITGLYHYGFILPEYSNFSYLVNAPIQSFSLQLSKSTTGKNDWERLYNYPIYGVSLYYSTLGNNQVHGKEWAIYPFFQLNILSGKRFNFYNQTGFGFGYITKKFDLETNYLNVAVGSHVNLHFNLKFGADYRLTEKLKLHTGVAFDHFSNGNLSEPNLGINWATWYTGLTYQPGHHDEKFRSELAPHKAGLGYEFIFSAGGKHPRSQDSRFYFTSSATFEGKWKLFRALHLGLGADVFYDTSTETEMIGSDLTNYKSAYDFRTGIHFSQEFVYSKLSLILQEGIYLVMTDRVNNKIMYNRWVVRYRVTPPVFVQIAMKSHLHILDYPEFGIGMKW